MRIGAHVRDNDPISAATERDAAVVQFFVADPQRWTAPLPHPEQAPDTAWLREQRGR